jgi:hypothetical protein
MYSAINKVNLNCDSVRLEDSDSPDNVSGVIRLIE